MRKVLSVIVAVAACSVCFGCAIHYGSTKMYLFTLGPAVLVVADREAGAELSAPEDEECDTPTSETE